MQKLIRRKSLKEKKYYRIAGLNKDRIQFSSTYSDKDGYTNLTADIKKHGYQIVVE